MTSDKLLETVSAAVDNEAGEFELRRVLDAASRDARVRDAWKRQHAVSAALRGEWRGGGDALRGRVWDALGGQPAPAGAGDDVDSRPLRGGLAALAAAAGIAAAVILTMTFQPDPAEEGAARFAERAVPGDEAPRLALGNEIPPADLERLNAYVMHHVQYKAMHQPGVSSFTKFVTYPAEALEDR